MFLFIYYLHRLFTYFGNSVLFFCFFFLSVYLGFPSFLFLFFFFLSGNISDLVFLLHDCVGVVQVLFFLLLLVNLFTILLPFCCSCAFLRSYISVRLFLCDHFLRFPFVFALFLRVKIWLLKIHVLDVVFRFGFFFSSQF